MNPILSEKQYQRYFIDKLLEQGYEEKPATEYDRLHAINPDALSRFLEATQPEAMAALKKIHKQNTLGTIISAINMAETAKSGSRLELLKHGIDISNHHLDLMYNRPATELNKKLMEKYSANIFTVSEEVWASDNERIDLVVFLNGIAIMAFELKCNFAGQNYCNAITQFRTDRNPKTRLFLWKAGVLVSFAMDLEQVHMTTRLANDDTYFLPFNKGVGYGITSGAGNPELSTDGIDDYSVHYMWDDILTKDHLLEIVRSFMFIEVVKKEDPITGKDKKKETIIFPRYHQLDVVRKVLADVKENRSERNYLLQHSAGSGKTNEIAWLAYRLSSLHDLNDRNVFTNVIICTDRVVVDRQLQDAILGLEHKDGQVKVLDDKCNAQDLKTALEGNTPIIATTIHKFHYIVDVVGKLSNKTFAVIIDEAHSSTAGTLMSDVTRTLGNGESQFDDTDDIIEDIIKRTGKQKNVSMFAFTATPKPTTLELFGTLNEHGQKEAFHIYSMKQAIEEGFICDVLQNYVTYDTFFKLNKEIEEDPEMKTSDAKRQIARFIQLHETNVEQRTEIIVEHFRHNVMNEPGGRAQAMIVTESRAGAVKYRQAFEAYAKRKGYNDIHALVAFSGKVCLDEKEYTEAGMNKIAEKDLTKEFSTDKYQVLIVADKYQTGYDEKFLAAMYVLKKIHGVSVVQTFSRLNRICPPFEKKTFILDFANSYEDVQKEFSKYYTSTILSNSVNPHSIYTLLQKIEGYYFLDSDDVEKFAELLHNKNRTAKDTAVMQHMLGKAHRAIENKNYHDEKEQKEIKKAIRGFLRCYEFLLQATSLDDKELHKKYEFLSWLRSYMGKDQSGLGFSLKGKLVATDFSQKKAEEHTAGIHVSDPNVRLSNTDRLNLTEEKKQKLSEIIAEINSRTGKNYDTEVAATAILQIKDLMKKTRKLQVCAKSNTLDDFSMVYNDCIDDALTDGLDQNMDFFTMLLEQPEIKHELLGMFVKDVYNSCRN